jgi:hypothetical protein
MNRSRDSLVGDFPVARGMSGPEPVRLHKFGIAAAGGLPPSFVRSCDSHLQPA